MRRLGLLLATVVACAIRDRPPSDLPDLPVCGDGAVDDRETCDGDTIACTTGSGAPGSQSCNASCSGYGECRDVTTTNPVCGNGALEDGEACDSSTEACTTPEGYAGTRTCNAACTTFDPCSSTLSCGDGTCTAPESMATCPADCPVVAPTDRTKQAGVEIRVRAEDVGFPRDSLVDDDVATSWRDTAVESWIEIDFGNTAAGAYAITEYTITSAVDEPNADPIWGLNATNDGSTWFHLQDGSGFTGRNQRLTFTLPSPALYRLYRFELRHGSAAFVHIAEIEMFDASEPICGNQRIEDGEVCDTYAQACRTNDYPGTSACNPTCDGWQACTTNLFCGDGVCTPGAEDLTRCPGDCMTGAFPPPPVYPGTCPVLQHGNNTGFTSLGQSRSFELRLPPDPVGAPVVFAWHALNATPQDAMVWGQLDVLYEAEGFIIVAPYSCCASEWVIGGNPASNPDLAIFDHVLACLYDQFSVDIERVYATGFSAGGLYTSYLLQERSGHLAAAAPFSGGLLGGYVTPDFDLPVMLVWGGPSDLYGSFSFEQATLDLSNALRADGHFVFHCAGNHGHTMPGEAGTMAWTFFEDHPRGVSPDPYAGGLPGAIPGWCSIPP